MSKDWAELFRHYRVEWLSVLLPILLYCVIRLPALLHQPGGQDEQFFAVPGWTVLREGIPRIPYLPTRNRPTFFENADRCLMAIPPALFYVQAPFFALFPPGYPTARLPSFFGALLVLLTANRMCRSLGATGASAMIACIALALSRPLLFTGIIARPDLLCILCGCLAMLVLLINEDWNRWQVIAMTGGLCGMAGLFHPLALVFGFQAAAAFLLASGGLLARLRRVVLLGVSTIAILALWLPLIWAFPYEFKSQFFSNVMDRAGPGIVARMVWPFACFEHHAGRILEFAGPWQCGLLGVALIASTIVIFSRASVFQLKFALALAWSSIYLTATVAGIHPTLGYWLYATILILVVFAAAMNELAVHLKAKALIWMIVILLLLPGAGLKTSWVFLRHFGDSQYHASKFIKGVLAELPEDGLVLADLSYVFDVYLSGRPTLYAAERQMYWGDQDIDFASMLVAWEGIDARIPEQYNTEFVKRFGSRDQPQTCYADYFKRRDGP